MIGEEGHASLEQIRHCRSVEDHESDLLPVFALVLAADDAHGPLELLAIEPQFAVERHVRQAGDEPVGGVIQVALARQELLAVPVGADAVELLAHPPAGQIDVAVPALGEEQRRSFTRRVGFLDRLLRQGAADASLLGRVAAQFAQVLAGAPFDGHRLVPPRRAGAGIDAADVLQLIGFAARTLNINRNTFFYTNLRHNHFPQRTLPCTLRRFCYNRLVALTFSVHRS